MSAAQEWVAPAEAVAASPAFGVIPGGAEELGTSRLVRAVATLAAACLLTAGVLVACAAVVSRWG